jgi:hypothetical protein
MTTLIELAAKAEAAAGPDRIFDAEVHRLITGGTVYDVLTSAGAIVDTVPAYSASLDAAMSLVPEGWTYWSVSAERIGTGNDGSRAEVSRLVDGDEEQCSGHATTPTLALCAAALRARAAQGNAS